MATFKSTLENLYMMIEYFGLYKNTIFDYNLIGVILSYIDGAFSIREMQHILKSSKWRLGFQSNASDSIMDLYSCSCFFTCDLFPYRKQPFYLQLEYGKNKDFYDLKIRYDQIVIITMTPDSSRIFESLMYQLIHNNPEFNVIYQGTYLIQYGLEQTSRLSDGRLQLFVQYEEKNQSKKIMPHQKCPEKIHLFISNIHLGFCNHIVVDLKAVFPLKKTRNKKNQNVS
jgi:hypothetical protein